MICSKRVAGIDLTGTDPALEPGNAFRAGPMGEGLRNDRSAGAALQRIVADLRGRVERRFNIPRFEAPTLLLLRAVGPHTGEAIRLQFEPHAERIGLRLAGLFPPCI